MIQIAGGSITGSRHQHRLNIKNNQDAFGWQLSEGTACAVICDGCSASKYSEVGAQMFALRIPRHVLSRQREICMSNSATNYAWDHIKWQIVSYMQDTYLPIKDYYLFTILGALITLDWVTVFSIGDGVVYINSEKLDMSEYPNNAPPYLAYELIQDSLQNPTPELYKFKIHIQMPVDEFQTCLIGSGDDSPR